MSDLRRRTYLNELLDMNGELIFAGDIMNTSKSISCTTTDKILLIDGCMDSYSSSDGDHYIYSINTQAIDCNKWLGYGWQLTWNTYIAQLYPTNYYSNTSLSRGDILRIGSNNIYINSDNTYSSGYIDIYITMYLLNKP